MGTYTNCEFENVTVDGVDLEVYFRRYVDDYGDINRECIDIRAIDVESVNIMHLMSDAAIERTYSRLQDVLMQYADFLED